MAASSMGSKRVTRFGAGEGVLVAYAAGGVATGARYRSDDDLSAARENYRASLVARGVARGPPRRFRIRLLFVDGEVVARVRSRATGQGFS